jgi:hypothetical protein
MKRANRKNSRKMERQNEKNTAKHLENMYNNGKLEEKLPLYTSSFTYRFIKIFIQFTFIKGKLYAV